MTNKMLIRMALQELYEDMKQEFLGLGDGYFYTKAQKEYALSHIDQYGVRATARILGIPRMTIQRWCRKYGIIVKRCPDWVFEWAARRKKRKEFWQRRGY